MTLDAAPVGRYDRPVEPRSRRILSVLSDTFWILLLAVVCLFAFFVALGAFSPGEVVGVTVGVGVCAALWLGHAVWQSRHTSGRDVRTVRARERRGF